MVTSLVPDEETLLRQQQSGLRVVDWPSVSRVVLNQRVQTNDPRGECCTTNYSAVWDLDEELIAFVADNLFCNTTVETLTESVLAPWREWETNTQVLNRVHRHGKDKSERYYSGNFPGVTSIIRDPMDVMLMLRRCFQPFLSTLLDSEQMYVVRAGVDQNLIEKQNHPDDAIDPVESILLSDDKEFYDSEEGEIDVSGDEVASGFAVLNNPILPKYKSSFWASVSLPPENITHMHSAPHTDGAHPGRASVYTLSKNKSYHVTATTFNRMRVSELTILNSQTLQQNHGGEVQKVQEEKIEAGESPLSGWLNTTTNRFSDVLAMAYNAHNRFTMYPSNRLHTAFIPDAKLLHSDPAIGRLSLNTFWETYLPKEDRNFCTEVTANAARALFDKIPSVVPLTAEEVLGLCRGCSAWPNYCGWCAATMSCNPHGKSCPRNEIVGAFGAHSELTCEDAAAQVADCVSHTSCKSCSTAGCTWCGGVGVCKPSSIAPSSSSALISGDKQFDEETQSRANNKATCNELVNPALAIGPLQPEKCKKGFIHVNCSPFLYCHTCVKSGCAWCADRKECVPATDEPCVRRGSEASGGNGCGSEERGDGDGGGGDIDSADITGGGSSDSAVVSGRGVDIRRAASSTASTSSGVTLSDIDKCPVVHTEPKQKNERSREDCQQLTKCDNCIDHSGCAWCIDPKDKENAGGKCVLDKQRACDSPSDHVAKVQLAGPETTKSKCPAPILLLPTPKPQYEVRVLAEHFVEDLPNSSHVVGSVAQIQTFADFNNVLSLHGDGTGLPVIIGFRSRQWCETCKKSEPHFKKLAEKFKNRAAFYDIEFDSGQSKLMQHLGIVYDGERRMYYKESDALLQSSQMNFYVQVYESSVLVGGTYTDATSGDLEQLETTIATIADESEKKGTYVGKNCVGEKSLREFFSKNDPTKNIDDVKSLSKKFQWKTAKLMRQLGKLYDVCPQCWPQCISTHHATVDVAN